MGLCALMSVELQSSLALQRSGAVTARFVRIGGTGNTASNINHKDSNEDNFVLVNENSEDRFFLSLDHAIQILVKHKFQAEIRLFFFV